MISPRHYDSRRININATALCLDRQYGAIDRSVQRRLHASPAYIDRLEQEAVLTGHEGCVNCLEWSSDGSVLASGSDDFQVILWDPFRKRRIYSIQTKHHGNMFSVKFLPRHNDALIATGAADKYIYVFDVNRYNEAIVACNCHSARVKRLATAPDSPFVFWSAGEDGAILQLDIREPHRCRAEENRVRLVNLSTYLDANAEARCLAINPRRTELMAVGANDPYARIYDRRMLHPVSTFDGGVGALINGRSAETASDACSIPKDCVTYYCPGHINKNNSRLVEHESRAITYLTFNEAGTELLVNMGGEHVYLYDLLSAEQPIFLSLPEYKTTSTMDVEATATTTTESANDPSSTTTPTSSSSSGSSSRRKQLLPEHIEAYKKMGNDFLENEKYLRAIDQYSEAIALAPDCSVLYLNRATAYMRRLWFGDVYAALRDCHQALRLDPAYIKAHFRLARALLELGRAEEADECLKELIARFPSYASNHGVMMLHKDIKENRQTTATHHQAYLTQAEAEAEARPLSAGSGSGVGVGNALELSDDEYLWRSGAKDYSRRFVGHCNTTTDIKEASYFGYDGEFIVAGSDDGNFFIWERTTGKIRAVYKADCAIVNCVQPHPDICMMATSGIDHDVKIWAPMAASPDERPHLVSYIDKSVEDNQQKMKTDPFDLNTRNTFCWNG